MLFLGFGAAAPAFCTLATAAAFLFFRMMDETSLTERRATSDARLSTVGGDGGARVAMVIDVRGDRGLLRTTKSSSDAGPESSESSDWPHTISSSESSKYTTPEEVVEEREREERTSKDEAEDMVGELGTWTGKMDVIGVAMAASFLIKSRERYRQN